MRKFIEIVKYLENKIHFEEGFIFIYLHGENTLRCEFLSNMDKEQILQLLNTTYSRLENFEEHNYETRMQ